MYIKDTHTPGERKTRRKNPNHSKNNGMSYSFVFFVVMVFRFHYDGMDITAVRRAVMLPLIISLEFPGSSFSLTFSFSFVLSCAELKTVCCWFKLAIVMLLLLTTARQPGTIINLYDCECFFAKIYIKKAFIHPEESR